MNITWVPLQNPLCSKSPILSTINKKKIVIYTKIKKIYSVTWTQGLQASIVTEILYAIFHVYSGIWSRLLTTKPSPCLFEHVQ